MVRQQAMVMRHLVPDHLPVLAMVLHPVRIICVGLEVLYTYRPLILLAQASGYGAPGAYPPPPPPGRESRDRRDDYRRDDPYGRR